jgi:hypothetical protein
VTESRRETVPVFDQFRIKRRREQATDDRGVRAEGKGVVVCCLLPVRVTETFP